jgi:hypothetical protein
MAIRGLSLTERNWYVTNNDPGKRDTLDESKEAGATVFYTGVIPNTQMTRIHDMVATSVMQLGDMTSQTFQQKTAGRNREAFRLGIRGWDNFYTEGNEDNEEGEPIEFRTVKWMDGGRTYDVIADDVMDQVPLAVVNEVGAHIFNQNSLGEDGRKKFEALLSQSGASDTSLAETATNNSDESGDATVGQNILAEPPTKRKQRTKKLVR